MFAYPFIVGTGTGTSAVVCDNCNRSFRRPQDMARHRCDSIRSRQTVAERINSVIMCSICGRTFSRRQDLSLHKCLPTVNDGIY